MNEVVNIFNTGILAKITIIVQYILGGLVALLALDNAVDAIAKSFGNNKIDTLCGIIAIKLNTWINKLKGVQQAPTPAAPTAVIPTPVAPVTTGG